MKRLKLLLLAILSGLLLGASWLPHSTFLIFTAFVPLLFLSEEIACGTFKRKKGLLFLLSYLTFLIWNVFDTWWIWFASEGGAVAAIVANALLMALVFLLYFSIYQKMRTVKPLLSYWMLIPVWLSFEYLHTHWDLAWTWLTVGNVFAFEPNWVQWYEYTGVSGGTTWALAINTLIFTFIKQKEKNGGVRLFFILIACITPILLSQIVLHTLHIKPEKEQQALIIQPNIDPYNEKFSGNYQEQMQRVYQKIKNKITDKTSYVALPETFLTENIWENNLENNYSLPFLKDSLLRTFPSLNIIVGATTLKQYTSDDDIPATARPFGNKPDLFYDVFNTAIQLNKKGTMLYHKSKLVPGVERMPYPALFKPLEKLAINLGGTFGSLGTQDTRSVFFNADKTVGIAPVVCYESIFGEYVTQYVKNGANAIFIITNDGWWGDTPGYKHHLAYACLRAIETRKQVVRSANTGISCLIDETGAVHAPQPWWKEAYLLVRFQPNTLHTFYVRFGDVLSKLACLVTLWLIGWYIKVRLRNSQAH
ncbi:MAG: apolipoprotein N-acyltransferase [Bacteroidetes bacterium]|nr:apolipoprotein N-acyltransferase [Bacteroidota bacterium]